jgi:hypothetical protein
VRFKDDNGNADDVTWQVGSSATMNPGASIIGNVLAYAAITANPGVSVNGRLLAKTEGVTIIDSTISIPPTSVPMVP